MLAVAVTVGAIAGQAAVLKVGFRSAAATGMALIGAGSLVLTQEGSRLGGWFGQFGGKDLEEWARVSLEEALDTEALLLGRRTDEWFAARWLSRSGAWAGRLNSLPKYVVSSTPEEPRWSNATVLKGEVVGEVSKLKQELAGDIVVYASVPKARMPARRPAGIRVLPRSESWQTHGLLTGPDPLCSRRTSAATSWSFP